MNSSRLVPINASIASSPAGGGHHRQKLDLIRTSLRPFQQKWSIVEDEEEEPEDVESEEEEDEDGEEEEEDAGGDGAGGGIRMLEGRRADMVRALVDGYGYDQESAFYALKLVNFQSVLDASNVLASIKKNLVQKQQNNQQHAIPHNQGKSNLDDRQFATTAAAVTTFSTPPPLLHYSLSPRAQPKSTHHQPLANVPNDPAWPIADRLAQSKSLPEQQQQQQQNAIPRSPPDPLYHRPVQPKAAKTIASAAAVSQFSTPILSAKATATAAAVQSTAGSIPQGHPLHQSQSFGPTDFLHVGRPAAGKGNTVIRIERNQSERAERSQKLATAKVGTGTEQRMVEGQEIAAAAATQKIRANSQMMAKDIAGHFVPSPPPPPFCAPSGSTVPGNSQLVNSPQPVQRIFINPQSAANVNVVQNTRSTIANVAIANRGMMHPDMFNSRISGGTRPTAAVHPAVTTLPSQQQLPTSSSMAPTAIATTTMQPMAKGSTNRCVSPLPESVAKRLKAGTYERVVKPCRAPMFRFFMEQHIEKLTQQYHEREKRARQLNREMEAADLVEHVKENMLRLLRQKESKYLRMRRQKMNLGMFELIRHIGIGAFGKVTLVRKRDTDQVYAMKTLVKADVIQKQQAAHVKAERDILAEANSPWIVKLFFSFQDTENLYFCMEYVPGGDMMQLLINMGIFTESLARFYIAELTLAVDYVHSLGFIHRDIKPDNILIDKEGHIKLTDFGLCTGLRWTHDKRHYVVYDEQQQNGALAAAAHFRDDSFSLPPGLDQRVKLLEMRHNRKRDRAHSVVGTGNYMAPEVIQRIGHTQLCDWWSVGVILYEMCYGRPPFMSQRDDPAETQYMIVHWRRFLDLNNPMGGRLSRNCVDFIASLCCDQEMRVGHRHGAKEIKAHPWFKGINFSELRNTQPEYVPRVRHPEDTSNFDTFEVRSDERAKWGGGGDGSKQQQQHQRLAPNFIDFTFRHFFSEGMGPSTGMRSQPQSRPSLAPLMEQPQPAVARQQQPLAANQNSNNKNHQQNPVPPPPNARFPSPVKKVPLAVQPSPPVAVSAPFAFQAVKNATVIRSSATAATSSPPSARTVLQIGMDNTALAKGSGSSSSSSGWKKRYPMEQQFRRPYQARLEEEIEPIEGADDDDEEQGETEVEESQC